MATPAKKPAKKQPAKKPAKKQPAKKAAKRPAKRVAPVKRITPDTLLPASVFAKARDTDPSPDPFPLPIERWKNFGSVFNGKGRSIAVWWSRTNPFGYSHEQSNGTVYALWVSEKIPQSEERTAVIDAMSQGKNLSEVCRLVGQTGVPVAKTVSILGVRWYPGSTLMSQLREAFDTQDEE